MHNEIILEEAIQGVLQYQEELGYSSTYIHQNKRYYDQLLKLNNNHGEIYLTDVVIDKFLKDCVSTQTHQFSKIIFDGHRRCIRWIEQFIREENTLIKPYSKPIQINIAEGFYEPLNLYDAHEEASGLSQSSLIKNRRPIRYLLEYMTERDYTQLSDIKHGDTIKAIEDMLEKHYSPSSLVTAISGLRRFYRMFDELQPYALEIPQRIPRQREIIDVYTEDEHQKIRSYLASEQLSSRDKAICLLSFETGLRNVDICKLKLNEIDWKHDTIHIVQSKTQRMLNLPLRSSYGNAMMNYILNDRPSSDLPYIFLSKKAPHSKLNNTWRIIKSVVERAGVNTTNRLTGTRMFRHNVASTMVRKGIPLPVIAEELGHKSQDSTMVYISTDHIKLSSLTLSVPKGGLIK